MKKPILLLVIALLITAFFAFDLGHYLTLDFLRQQRDAIQAFYADNRVLTIALYALLYVTVTALSLPGALIMTLAGGAIFGLATGTVVVSLASTTGATLAFLVSRFLLRDWVQGRFADRLTAINAGIEKDGPFYLFTLRLIPLFPFFVINLAMGITPIGTWQYFAVSLVGMLPGTLVYVNAGSQLAGLERLADVLSPTLLVSFALLGLLPLVAKKTVAALAAYRTLAAYKKPAHFDYNLVVIGAGSAGLVSAYIAAAVRARVALIEKDRMGGDCLNSGCVPSKALLRSARVLSLASRAAEFGFREARIDYSFAEVMARVQHIVAKIAPHDSVERYTALGVEVVRGTARIRTPYEIDVDGRTLTTRSIIVATGARPAVPDIPGLEQLDYLTSDTVWTLRERPQRLLVLGGGPIGCELAQAFNRLGCQVTLVQRGPHLLPREDGDVSEQVEARLAAEGIRVLSGHSAQRFEGHDGGRATLICEHEQRQVEVEFDRVLLALGRQANVSGFGLEELGVTLEARGTVAADPFLRTNFPNLYVCGDVTGPYQFTHTASHQAWYAAVNALFSPLKKFRVDYSVIPWATYTDPEVARVGLNENEARARGTAYELTTYNIADLDRAIIDGEDHGMIKVLTVPGKDRILGVTIVASHASELISEFVIAMKHGLGLNRVLATIHIYPTMAESGKYAAGAWKRAHAPQRLLQWLARFHRWRRGRS